MDPVASNMDEINSAQYGTAPNRRFVVNFYQVPHYSTTCNSLRTTIQVVLYETTNNIEVFIKEKPFCEEWNNGNAVLGIQNSDGTIGIAAPNRNTSDSPWEAYNEAWRFSSYEGDTVEAYPFTFSVCDQGNGGFEAFDFSLIESDLIGNQSNVTVSYHSTFLDANDNFNPLVSPFVNTSNPQTVYARVENSEGLYTTADIVLEVISCLDNDQDGVATEDEDLNGDGYPGNDDTDNDGIPNYLDPDDDDDTVDTIIETTGIGAGLGGHYTYIDTDEDGIENYIDNDDDGILTVFEDYNENGTPLDDDLNNNGIPDFLDNEILGVESSVFESLILYPNPTEGVVYLHSTNLHTDTQIRVLSIQGKEINVSKNYLEVNKLSIDLSQLETGVYFIQITNQGGTVSKKIVKK